MQSDAARLLASLRKRDVEHVCAYRHCRITFMGRTEQKFCSTQHRRKEEYLREKDKRQQSSPPVPPAEREGDS